MSNKDEALNWDSVIEDIPKEEYQQLEDGEYNFVVSTMEQDKWKPETKNVGGFPYALLTIAIMDKNNEQIGSIKTYLTLSVKNQWRIREFFASIGYPIESGKAFAPKWTKVEGAKGRCKVKKDDFVGRNGEKIKSNKIEKFLEAKAKIDTSDIPNDDDLDF